MKKNNMKRYFTLKGAQLETRIIPQHLSNDELQRHIVRLRDFKRYIDNRDIQRLIDGGYYDGVVDSSASGIVPKDIWLQTNLGQSLDEALRERQERFRPQTLAKVEGK